MLKTGQSSEFFDTETSLNYQDLAPIMTSPGSANATAVKDMVSASTP